MCELIIKKNNEVDDVLLDEVLQFDRGIFSSYDDYAFPDDYLKKLYEKSKDGMFVLLNDNQVVGYVNCIFLSDKNKDEYLQTKDYLSLENIAFKTGYNNMYFYTLALDEKYRDTNAVKYLMSHFAKWLYEEKQKGKIIKSCITEIITEDGISSALKMQMEPVDIDNNGLGIYYSPDCLNNYIDEMIHSDYCSNKIIKQKK